MVSQAPTNELYNLRWNSYFTNLINIFTDHQNQETLVDVTLGCEGQFIKAHKLVLSACSVYFQKIFQSHTSSQLLILLNDVKFESLRLVIQFMYKGEVKVADSDMQNFLHLGKLLQVKGLCSVELQDKQKQNNVDVKKNNPVDTKPPEKNVNEKANISVSKKLNPPKSTETEQSSKMQKPVITKEVQKPAVTKEAQKPVALKEKQKPVILKKRKLSPVSSPPPDIKKKNVEVTSSCSNNERKQNIRMPPSTPEPKKKVSSVISPNPVIPSSPDEKDVSHIPRPPNAFMIFANQWRKKLAVEYPNESNKDISVRLGNMWKSLSPDTKETFYDDAKKADEEHKIKYPGYYYSPKEARYRKAIANNSKTQKFDGTELFESEFIEIKCEEPESFENSTSSNGSN